jgi:hypothetical protein
MTRPIAAPLAGLVLVLLAGCAGTPSPEWAMEAHAAMARTLDAALQGDARVEAAEFGRARAQLSRTGRPELLARAELMRCAAHAARLDLGPCPGFEALRVDAQAAERAYADYLLGHADAAAVALLPAHHQAVQRAGGAALAGIDDPLARLVAAATLLQAGRAGPATVSLAVEAASERGWRRTLLAWLGVQRRMAEQRGDAAEAARIRRRLDAATLAPR